jgi:hypothetical protein
MFAKPPATMSKLDTPALTKQGSIIMRQVVSARPTIVEKPMEAGCQLNSDVLNICRFSISEDDTGMYHISSQFCVRNNGTKPAQVGYYQVGIATEDMTGFEQNVKSILCKAECLPSYSICDGLDTVMELKAGSYVLWLNLASTGGPLDYVADCSHLRLYRL